jgi:hypothetical protein
VASIPPDPNLGPSRRDPQGPSAGAWNDLSERDRWEEHAWTLGTYGFPGRPAVFRPSKWMEFCERIASGMPEREACKGLFSRTSLHRWLRQGMPRPPAVKLLKRAIEKERREGVCDL